MLLLQVFGYFCGVICYILIRFLIEFISEKVSIIQQARYKRDVKSGKIKPDEPFICSALSSNINGCVNKNINTTPSEKKYE